jgi:predicted enzyme related to lactoylglutathione lyase
MKPVRSQITFLYYRDLEPIARFYEQVMGFDKVEDQGWAKIYRSHGNAFVGIVDEQKGFHRAQATNAVMLTFVVDDVPGWYDHLRRHGVELITEPTVSEAIQVEYFFCKDPGGYVIEIERFLKPALEGIF